MPAIVLLSIIGLVGAVCDYKQRKARAANTKAAKERKEMRERALIAIEQYWWRTKDKTAILRRNVDLDKL